MLIEVMLVLLLVSITCCSLLTGYKACVLAMQQYNRLELAFELLEVRNVEAADALAAEQGLFIERKEFIDNLQIKQEIITVRECRNQKVLVNKVRYALSNKGFLLVELNLALIFIITTSLMFAGGVRQLLQGWQRIQSDIMLRRAANYSFSLPERELFLHAATVTISNTGYKGSSKIICQDVFGSRQITFYLSGNILYRQTKSNSLKGVNVLSLASVKIEEFRAERLNYRELMLTIKIQDTKSGRRITSSKVLLLGNGVIEG